MASLFLVPAPAPATGDQQARHDALDTTRSWIVEAPAGSGKTGLLIQRFLKLLTAENVSDPAEVLAITFTRKATVEMRDRVLQQLTAAAQNTPTKNTFDELTRPLAQAALAKSNTLAWSLLDYPRRLNIRTIDSIAADIARSLPILSGSSGALTPTEDASPLYAEAARRTLMHLGGPDARLSAALRLILLHRDADLAGVQNLIATMLRTRDQWGELIPLATSELTDAYLDTQVLPKFEKALDQAICRALTRLNSTVPSAFLEQLCHLAAEMSAAEGYKGSPSPIAICAGRYSRPEEKAEHLDHWRALIKLLVTGGGDFRKRLHTNDVQFLIEKHHKAELLALIDQVRHDEPLRLALCAVAALPPATYPPVQWPITKALFRLLSRALAELQFVFAEHAACDFAELGLLAKSALRRDSSVEDLSRNTGQTLQHLLCDEMQDTSTSQYELIQLLTERWDGHSQTVFLVGDPKQSIYLFRQARVERFVRTMHLRKLGDLPLGVLHLTANFRSQATLVQQFNEDFTQLFPTHPDPSQPEQVPYLPAVAARKPAPGPARTWYPSPIPYTGSAPDRTAIKQAQATETAQQIRRIAAEALASPHPTVAVLVRNRSHLLEIVKALKQTPALPFRAVEIEPLAERQEILDLIALTRALLHPADRTAALALLRTPWCGLTLVDLHLLAGADDPTLAQTTLTDLIAQRGDLLSADGIARLEPFWLTLQAAYAQRGRMPVSQWIERTWRAFNAPAYATTEELLNSERFFSLLDQIESAGNTVDLDVLTTRLGRLFAEPALHPGAVDLMTIHGAKGLEWDTVIVPALDRTAASNRGQLLSWLEIDGTSELADETVAHSLLAPISPRGQGTAELNAWMRSIESAREAAERKRLFYVACTRAREALHLFASPQQKKDGTIAPAAGSLLHAAWPAAESIFAATPPAILQMPSQPVVLDRIAAEAPPTRTILRIPLQPTPAQPPQATAILPQTDRPEGSFASRSFGNTVHAFLSLLTQSTPPDDIRTWLPRIHAVLRASGLTPSATDRLAQRVLQALSNTLADPEGRWLLAQHPAATTESSIAISTPGQPPRTLRLDRTFRAGPTPGTPGDHLWIVDFKTADPGGRDLKSFLAEEQQKYAPQLQAYAEAHPGESIIHTALYYPMIPRLILQP